MGRRLPPRLLALTPGTSTSAQDGARLVHFVVSLREGGLKGCLLREPGLEDADFYEVATRLRGELPGFWLGVHDRIHVAISAGADGVHLGFRSLAPDVARRALMRAGAADMTVGLSTHAGDDVEAWQAADYIFHGPVFDTPSKAGLVESIGVAGLERAVAQHPAVWALGGMRADRVANVFQAGAAGVAVLGALSQARHPQEVLRDLVASVAAANREGE